NDLDRWAADRTLGLIKRFPIVLTPEDWCVLATALATRVSWEVPFDVVDAAALGPSPWATRLRHVLRTPLDPRHRQYVVRTERAGIVAVHVAEARGGLVVGSVIAADPDVSAADVLAAAEETITAEARRQRPHERVSLFDLPLGDAPVWSIVEEEVETSAPQGQEERIVSVLPGWTAQ